MSITYSECLSVALFVQHAKRMRRIILSYVDCLAAEISTFFPKRHDFEEKKNWTWNVCFDFLYNFCLKHFSLQEEFSEIRS